MKFLENVEIGDEILVKRINAYGDISYYKDIILRVLKTKIVTKTNEFYTKNGESLENNEKIHNTLVEYTDDVEEYMLREKYNSLLKSLSKMKFEDNKKFENFIDKIKNIYNANLIKKRK